MPPSVIAIFNFLVSVGLTASVFSAGVIWLSKQWLSEKIKSQIKSEYDEKLATHKAQLKAQGDVAIEKLKSDLSVAAAQQQVRFSNLHQRRGEVIAEVYAALRTAAMAVADYTKPFEPAGGRSRDERRMTAIDAVNAFTTSYTCKKIFLPETAAEKVDALNTELKNVMHKFLYEVDAKEEQSQQSTNSWLEVHQRVERLSNIAIRELERDFRQLLGDDVAGQGAAPKADVKG